MYCFAGLFVNVNATAGDRDRCIPRDLTGNGKLALHLSGWGSLEPVPRSPAVAGFRSRIALPCRLVRFGPGLAKPDLDATA